MKLAIISDLHGDLTALDAALGRARDMGCELVICAGDLVDGGVFPDEVIARLASERIPTIRGNHDRWALERAGVIRPRRRRVRRSDPQPLIPEIGESKASGGAWDPAPASLAFLGELPMSWSAVLDEARVVMWHASPDSDMKGIYPDQTQESEAVRPGPGGLSSTNLERHLDEAAADVLIVGHTHQAFAWRTSAGRLIVNPGAL